MIMVKSTTREISNNSGLNDGEYNGDGDGDGDDYYGDRDDESMGLTEKEENEFGGLGTLSIPATSSSC